MTETEWHRVAIVMMAAAMAAAWVGRGDDAPRRTYSAASAAIGRNADDLDMLEIYCTAILDRQIAHEMFVDRRLADLDRDLLPELGGGEGAPTPSPFDEPEPWPPPRSREVVMPTFDELTK